MSLRYYYPLKQVCLAIAITGIQLLSGEPVKSQRINLPCSFDKSVQVSAITIHNGKVYLPAEKCKKIFIYNESSLSTTEIKEKYDSIDLTKEALLPEKIAIEGITCFKENLFLIDEKNSTVYAYNLATKKLSTVTLGKPFNLNPYSWDKKNEFGLEGIAIDPANSICYILREKVALDLNVKANAQWRSAVYAFKLKPAGESFTLDYLDSLPLRHDNKYWRCSDITFDEVNKRLLLLKVNYDKKNCANSKYEVAQLALLNEKNKNWPAGLSIISAIPVCGYGAKVSTNMEGLFFKDNSLLVISDNLQSDTCKCTDNAQETLLIKISLNNTSSQPSKPKQ